MSDWEPLSKLSLDEVGQRIDVRSRSTEHLNIVLTGIRVESEIITESNVGGAERHYPGRTRVELEGVDCRFAVDTYATWRYAS